MSWFWWPLNFFYLARHHPEDPPMPTINELFTEATGDDVAVAADKTKLDADTAKDVADHATLTQQVIANGPTLVTTSDGTLVGLIPQDDGTIKNIVFKDGSKTAPTPTP